MKKKRYLETRKILTYVKLMELKQNKQTTATTNRGKITNNE